ncbi:hypothetical protein BH11ARM1_BH11ARM1_16560 [soil metagenome]
MNYSEDLKAYLDAELSAGRAAEIEAQLAVDESLRKDLGELRAVGQALSSISVPASVGMEATLIRLQTGRAKPIWLRPVLALGACAVIFAVFFPMTLRGSSGDSADANAVVAMKSVVVNSPSASPPLVSMPTKRDEVKGRVAPSRPVAENEAILQKGRVKSVEVHSSKTLPPPRHDDPTLAAPKKAPDVSGTVASAAAGVAAFASQPVVTVTVASVDDAERRIRDWAKENGGAVSEEVLKTKDLSARKDSIVTVTVDEPDAKLLLNFLQTVDRPVPAPSQRAAMDSTKGDTGRATGGAQHEIESANQTQLVKPKELKVEGTMKKTAAVRKTIRIKLVVKPPTKTEPE